MILPWSKLVPPFAQFCRHFPHRFICVFSFFGSWNLQLLEAAASGKSHGLDLVSIFDRPSQGYHSQLVERTPAEELAQTPQGRPVVERYREFVTTHSERIYPEYLLAVRRVQEREVHFWMFLREMILKCFHWFPNAIVCSLLKKSEKWSMGLCHLLWNQCSFVG